MPLNASQELAFTKLMQFLANPNQQFFALKAPAGFGKSHLLNHLAANLDLVNMRCKLLGVEKVNGIITTATTNKAASNLGPSIQTIYKTLNISLWDDYKTGKTRINTANIVNTPVEDVVTIDEASFVDNTLHTTLYQVDSKIIYVGDDCQLKPINAANMPAFTSGYPEATLTEPMRQDPNSRLYMLCVALRQAVLNQQAPTKLPGGAGIQILTKADFDIAVAQSQIAQENSTVLAYRNTAVDAYNIAARHNLNKPLHITAGDIMVNKGMYEGTKRISPETRLTVQYVNPQVFNDTVYPQMQYRKLNTTQGMLFVPIDIPYWKALIKHLIETKNWADKFRVEKAYANLQDGWASTVHGAQGSTFNRVFIDVGDLKLAKDMDTYLRLFYTAVTRATTEVILTGV